MIFIINKANDQFFDCPFTTFASGYLPVQILVRSLKKIFVFLVN